MPDWLTDPTNLAPVDFCRSPLKALLMESDFIDVQQQALDLAAKHVKKQARDEFEAFKEAISDLKRLERYERQAWSQKKQAIHNFMNIQLMRNLQNADLNKSVTPALGGQQVIFM